MKKPGINGIKRNTIPKWKYFLFFSLETSGSHTQIRIDRRCRSFLSDLFYGKLTIGIQRNLMINNKGDASPEGTKNSNTEGSSNIF